MTSSERSTSARPAKHAPGLLGKLVGGLMQIVGWVFLSLLFSIVVEMVGIAFIWSDEGSLHAKQALEQDLSYLNRRISENVGKVEHFIKEKVEIAISWVDRLSAKWFGTPSEHANIMRHLEDAENSLERVFSYSSEYIRAIPYVIKTFFVRLVLLIFSLPAFALFFALGMVDGLVERDLRRWGGGRESSMVYNLARKSIFRFFIAACVIYISLPFSLNPVWIVLPFSVAFGLSTRVTFERLKKYF